MAITPYVMLEITIQYVHALQDILVLHSVTVMVIIKLLNYYLFNCFLLENITCLIIFNIHLSSCFISLLFFSVQPVQEQEPSNPCVPSPCGPNSICNPTPNGESYVCSCEPTFEGSPPHCRRECTTSDECPSNRACINYKCKDPCPGSCGTNTQCNVRLHSPMCSCDEGYTGDPFTACYLIPQAVEKLDPCNPTPCGANAQCKVSRNNAAACICEPGYFGNPYESCRPECVVNTDCPYNKACLRNKCEDPCPGVCGSTALCQVINHVPSCNCAPGYTGNPYTFCHIIINEPSKFIYNLYTYKYPIYVIDSSYKLCS